MKLYKDNITESNEIEKLDGKIIIDFVNVRASQASDMKILNNWKNDFLQRNIPFILTGDHRQLNIKGIIKAVLHYTLWIKETVPPIMIPSKKAERQPIIYNHGE